ncbi:hypothetical protein GMO_15730 [Gluconobacter morbifer G707]|uniref:Uncharacterized protein n=1 Tax=Gluconobacter morbifer G707 TaxID=1088869 RepID=G6XJA7_9PROT|nr:hypothetical protein GMO_15730 [Gluconobacter morbifer G707]
MMKRKVLRRLAFQMRPGGKCPYDTNLSCSGVHPPVVLRETGG